MMSPGKTSRPQCCNGDELDSVRKPIDRRPGLHATVQICGEDTSKRCTQSRLVPACVISTRKSSFVVGSISTSADRIAAWHDNGSTNLRTLLQGISASLEAEKSAGYSNGARPARQSKYRWPSGNVTRSSRILVEFYADHYFWSIQEF